MTPRRPIRLLRDGFPDPPALDTAVSRAILLRVSGGREPETLRIHRPGAVVAFGPMDRLSPGYATAVAVALERGFGAVQRLAGGRAAVFHPGTIAFSLSLRDSMPRDGIRNRFGEVAGIVTEAVRALGADARVGEVPGEYCPGTHSVNAGGRTKLAGIGQRLVAGAAHVGGVVVVTASAPVRDVLVPVYAALGLGWDPDTVGSLEDEVPGVTWEMAERALADAFAARFELVEGEANPEVLDLAARLLPQHTPDCAGRETEGRLTPEARGGLPWSRSGT